MELPKLPEPEWSGYQSKDDPDEYYAYTSEQMRAYALAAVEAERERLQAKIDNLEDLLRDERRE